MESPNHHLDNGNTLPTASSPVATEESQKSCAQQEGSEALGDDDHGAALREWSLATETLRNLLDRSDDGIASSRALRAELEKRGVADARESVVKLKLFNFDNPPNDVCPPSFRYFHRGRSFYSKEAHERAEAETDQAAKEAEQAVEAAETREEIARPARQNRQEEARLVKYVEEALEDIYASDYGPDVKVAYDVHSERPGNEFENMDAVAVHWRSDKVVELVGVEVKLEFSPRLIQQALNYRRFCHRVWIALPVSTDEPATELRESDSLLFDYVVEQGVGILGCRRRQGGSYEVWPVHWPQRNRLDAVAREEFLVRYRHVFEQACVIEPSERRWSPRLS